MNDLASQLTLATLAKIGSALVHAEEYMGEGGHDFDKAAFDQMMADPAVQTWLESMKSMSLVPRKRSE